MLFRGRYIIWQLVKIERYLPWPAIQDLSPWRTADEESQLSKRAYFTAGWLCFLSSLHLPGFGGGGGETKAPFARLARGRTAAAAQDPWISDRDFSICSSSPEGRKVESLKTEENIITISLHTYTVCISVTETKEVTENRGVRSLLQPVHSASNRPGMAAGVSWS